MLTNMLHTSMSESEAIHNSQSYCRKMMIVQAISLQKQNKNRPNLTATKIVCVYDLFVILFNTE